jgi:hypothetical protein
VSCDVSGKKPPFDEAMSLSARSISEDFGVQTFMASLTQSDDGLLGDTNVS